MARESTVPQQGQKGPALFFLVLAVFLLFFAFSAGKSRLPGGFIADEAVYYMMAQSLYEDGDLEWTLPDLRSVSRTFPGGPRNVILMTADGGQTVHYAKPYIYSLCAVPFFALFAVNGFLVFNTLMFLVMVGLSWRYLGQFNSSGLALFMAGTFFFLSAAFPYIFWIHPEVFNMFTIFLGCYFWIFSGPDGRKQEGPGESERPPVGFRSPAIRAMLAGFFFALAAFSKFPHAAFGAAVVFHGLMSRQWKRTAAALLVFCAMLGLLHVCQWGMTGTPSVYHVARRSFSGAATYPHLVDPEIAWGKVDPRGVGQWGGGGFGLLDLDRKIPYNIVYFFIGRHTGLVPYFFPGVLALFLFLFRGGWRAGGGRGSMLLAVIAVIIFYLLWLPFNYPGGGGFIGNRYFASVYPVFLFLLGSVRGLAGPVLCWLTAGLFLSQIIFTPFGANIYRKSLQAHVRNPIFRILPYETTLRKVPGYVDIRLGRRGGESPYLIRLLDQNVYPEGTAFWVRGEKSASILIITRFPLERIVFQCSNDHFEARTRGAAGKIGTRTLRFVDETSPTGFREAQELELVLENPKPRAVHAFGWEDVPSWYYVVTFTSSTGFIPIFSHDGSDDVRYLGTRFEFTGEGESWLRDEYFTARLQSLELPERLHAGEELGVPIRIRSHSPFHWDDQVRLSYHWYRPDEKGEADPEKIVWNGIHTFLPQGGLEPGAVWETEMRLAAPEDEGVFLLVVDMVRDQVAWFAERDEEERPLGRFTVQVVNKPDSDPGNDTGSEQGGLFTQDD